MNVYLRGKRVSIDPAATVGSGGEAEVFDIGGGRALKLFKQPEHPDHAGQPGAKEAARERLRTHQTKLRSFPAGLPPRVIAPQELATDRGGAVLGYTMALLAGAQPLLRYGERPFREGRVPQGAVVELLCDLHRTLQLVHERQVVVGDLNDLNVLVTAAGCHLIDSDSFQFGGYLCTTFTDRFVDPLRCDPGALSLAHPHTADSDWYAFAVMVMQSLLYVGPYGGVHAPPAGRQRVQQQARPLSRLTVFHPEVRYPRPALPYGSLPDALLHHLQQVFEKDLRGPFPLHLVADLRFSVCPGCGAEHARRSCPGCAALSAPAAQPVLSARGEVRMTVLYRAPRGGLLLEVAAQEDDERPLWLAYDGGHYLREDGARVAGPPPGASSRFLLLPGATLVYTPAGGARPLGPGRPPISVDAPSGHPALARCAGQLVWASAGQLLRDGPLGPEPIGEVLCGQTRIWGGPGFGLGLSRAGALHVGLVFSGDRRGINDGVVLPALPGEIIEADCALSGELAWLLIAARSGPRTRHHCVVVRRDGQVVGAAAAERGDGTWLGQAPLSGKCAVGRYLFCPTDAGVVRVEIVGGEPRKTRDFPDTEPYVSAGTRLLCARAGLCAADARELRLLTLG